MTSVSSTGAPSISNDGRYVVFELGGTGFNSPSEVWLYDRQEGAHRRLSGGFDGFATNYRMSEPQAAVAAARRLHG